MKREKKNHPPTHAHPHIYIGERPLERNREGTSASNDDITIARGILHLSISRSPLFQKKRRTERFLTPVSPDSWHVRILFSTVDVCILLVSAHYAVLKVMSAGQLPQDL